MVKRSCNTCVELRFGGPDAPGYVGCAWGYTPVVPGTKPEHMKYVGNLLMVQVSRARLDQACDPDLDAYRPRCAQHKTQESGGRDRTNAARQRAFRERKRAAARSGVMVPCWSCGRPHPDHWASCSRCRRKVKPVGVGPRVP